MSGVFWKVFSKNYYCIINAINTIVVEQKIGQIISDSFCAHFGEDQSEYLNPANYLQKASNAGHLKGLIAILDRVANTFGQISKMYSILQMPQQRQVVTAFTDLTTFQLSSILSCLTYFRNVCAHNERLYSFRLLQHNFPNTALHGKEIIYYNDMDYKYDRQNFTILHEIGHIVLDYTGRGEHVANLRGNRHSKNGEAVYGIWKGVRVGVIRTNGKIATIFPDSKQPYRKGK